LRVGEGTPIVSPANRPRLARVRKHRRQHVCEGKPIMQSNAQHHRDPLRFSRRGVRLVNSYAMQPVIADDGINRAWDARLRRRSPSAPCGSGSASTRQIEAFLARYYAHGCCNAA
jgi:hypothetical protein